MMFLVFDVESVGLHGEAFAVGWVLIKIDNGEMRVLSEGCAWCDHAMLRGGRDSHAWVDANVSGLRVEDRVDSPHQVRHAFWSAWAAAKDLGASLAADCLWPVEARFLAACIDDDHPSREWHGPYPFVDIASVALGVGADPLASHDRAQDELPAHNPLADARQSARLLALHLAASGARHT